MLKFIQSLASFRGDLSALTAPPFLLSTFSHVEFPSLWTENSSTFIAPSLEPDTEQRALLVLKWFLSALKQQYASRSDKLGGKSPLNPFLGELFLGKWDNDAGCTHLIAEQVCHHPPVTAYFIRNDKHQISGYNAQKASFSGTVRVEQVGHAVLHLERYNEDYIITLPAFHVKGLLSGNPYLELEKTTHIYSSTGFISRITYSGKGWFSGKRAQFAASLCRNSDHSKVLYSIHGQWTETFTIEKGNQEQPVATYDTTAHENIPLTVEDIKEQDVWESRRAWSAVTTAIKAGNMFATGREKSKIEVAQREMRKEEQAKGNEWERAFFRRKNGDTLFEKLAGQAGERLDVDRSGGVWRFDEAKAKNAKKPYHGDLTPTGKATGTKDVSDAEIRE
ncbi:MAG: hypothetical protein Q9217_001181 [Psora testacea]